MSLIGIKGSPGAVNAELLLYAIDASPTLFLDCANCADPHRLFPFVLPEQFENVYVIEIELVYLLRDVLKKVPAIAKDVAANCIIVTTHAGLFSYNDENENNNVLGHAWKLLKNISKEHEVLVGVSYEGLAEKYCDKIIDSGGLMGHTVASQRMVVEMLLQEFNSYSKSLRQEDRVVFEQMMKQPLKHLGNISYASSFHTWAFVLLSVMLEQEKRLRLIEKEITTSHEVP